MLTIETPPQYLDIIQHDNHFYEFIFKKGSRATLDEWFIYMEQLFQLPSDTIIKVLINSIEYQPPLTYAFRHAKEMIKKYPNRPKPMRIVFMENENQGALHRILQSFVQLLSTGDSISYVYGNKHEQAVNFLFEKEPHLHPAKSAQ